ncbi:unnamed protein product [Clonostachys byssicola]|uniref:Uncharacterized protein n=1 Tax=Clonostachys byssicola TaxID=160290 RepID=A0A9N9UHM2_9HYPO|nr:unnamed protein product [Clonostachys byssicola]
MLLATPYSIHTLTGDMAMDPCWPSDFVIRTEQPAAYECILHVPSHETLHTESSRLQAVTSSHFSPKVFAVMHVGGAQRRQL